MFFLNVVIYFLIGFLVTRLVKIFLKYRRIASHIDKIAGPPRLWLPVGNALQLSGNHFKFFQQIRQLAKDYREQSPTGALRLWIGPYPYVIMVKGKAAEAVLSSYKFLEKGPDYDLVHPWLGTGLLTSTGDKWRSRRKFLTPAFHFQILNEFIDVFHEQSKVLIDCLTDKADSGEAFDISPFISRCTLDIICETAMGKKIHAQTRSDSTYVAAVYRASALVYHRVINPFLRPDSMYSIFGPRDWTSTLKTLHSFTDSVILERQSDMHEQRPSQTDTDRPNGKRKAFLDLLLSAKTEDGKVLDNASIREEVDTFMFEGHDTTSVAAAFAVFLLGNHQDVQQKAYEELRQIFGDSDRAPTTEDLKNMRYLDCVLKESLRLYPSVPMITRKCNEDYKLPDSDIIIPEGSIVSVFIFALGRDPDMFPEPDRFDPERFSDTKSARHGPFDYVPFSAGPRNCIGQKFAVMEEKTILSTILRSYTIQSVEDPETLRIAGELITRPIDGISVKLFRR
ncbi:Cytochrome P450 4V2 [Hypsibius exemplaris]|uniref:Cytochrome P450 4V2 n=1 Tax=Hypsibius exemplaris TaxID=2072580 RepID=A0A1W0WV87_HYPEX|nr:Cytochrome P450 4V2 [Hypsibius exemplaris]